MRDQKRIDYKQKAPPKLPAKRATRAKRQPNADDDEIEIQSSSNKKSKGTQQNAADALLKSFMSPIKQRAPAGSQRG